MSRLIIATEGHKENYSILIEKYMFLEKSKLVKKYVDNDEIINSNMKADSESNTKISHITSYNNNFCDECEIVFNELEDYNLSTLDFDNLNQYLNKQIEVKKFPHLILGLFKAPIHLRKLLEKYSLIINLDINNIDSINKALDIIYCHKQILMVEKKLQTYINNKIQYWKTDDPVIVLGFDEGQILIQKLAQTLLDMAIISEEFMTIYENRVNNYENDLFKIGLKMSIGCCKSKQAILKLDVNTKIGIVVPVYSEKNRIKPYTFDNFQGENALNVKIIQLMWLLDNPIKGNIKLLFIGDNDSSGSIDEITSIIKKMNLVNLPVQTITLLELSQKYSNSLKFDTQQSIKGGSIIYGLYDLWNAGYSYGVYCDFDITCPISHAGILIDNLINNNETAIVSYSRRHIESFGYYWGGTQNMVSSLFQQINRELLSEDLYDINVGFKCIDLKKMGGALDQAICNNLAFDSELIILMKKMGYKIKEIPGCFLHKYVNGKQGVSRDYNLMLQTTAMLLTKHLAVDCKHFNLYYCMSLVGGFYNLVGLLELIKREYENNEEAIFRFSNLLEV